MPKASTFGHLVASQVVDSDCIPLITNAGDNKLLPVSEARTAIGPGYSSTVNAFNEVGATREIKIQAAIARAVSTGADRVFVPSSMLPYDATLITFNTAIQMVREGGVEWSSYDVGAYGAAANGSTDDLTAINAARLSAVTAGRSLVFPSGTYGVSNTLNLGYAGLASYAVGVVIIKYLGVSAVPVLSIDSGGDTIHVRHVKLLGDFRVQGNAFTSKGLYCRGLGDSEIECAVIDGGGIAFHTAWSTLTRYKLSESQSLSAFTTIPSIGVQVDESTAGFYTADCWFDLVIETVTGTGVYVKSGSGNIFKGSSEGITGKGIVEDAGCDRNVFESFDCESNTVSDAELSGASTVLNNCYMGSASSSANVLAGGDGLVISGGYIRWVQCTGSDSLFVAVKFDDNGSAGIKGSGTYKTVACVLVGAGFAITGRLEDVLGTRGTFTPTIAGASVAGTQTYNVQTGTYHRVDNVVNFRLWVNMTAKDAATAGAIAVRGLPFAARATYYQAVSIGEIDNITYVGRTHPGAYIAPNATEVALLACGSGVAAIGIQAADIVASTGIMLWGSYEI